MIALRHRIPLVAGIVAALAMFALVQAWPVEPPPIRIGVLHSSSGTMAVSEKPLIQAATLAVEEINAGGGIAGRRLEVVLADGRSDPAVFAAEAERLIEEERVSALFGCWTSASRQAVKPVVERHDHLLFYPVQYEGMEQSPNIVYLGAAPNQQITPAVRWTMETFGNRLYLVGSDYVFPRVAHRVIREVSMLTGGRVIGERLLPLGTRDVSAVLDDLVSLRPDAVLNTVNGDSNAALFAALAESGLADLPVISFSASEVEMSAWGGGRLNRHYAAWHYFESLSDIRNREFVTRWQHRFGADARIGGPAEATYAGIRLWARAVQAEGNDDPRRINGMVLFRQSFAAPSGPVSLDPGTRHAWKMFRAGKVRPDGEFEEVYASPMPLRPTPWPLNRSRTEWAALLQ